MSEFSSLSVAAMPLHFDTVIFDLGGVLIDWNPRRLYRRLFDGDEAAMEDFLKRICSPAWNERQDAGRPWSEAIAELSAQFPAQAELIAAYRERWHEMLGGPLHDTVQLLYRLHGQGLRLLALTNWSQETFPIAFEHEQYAFLHRFEGILVSGAEGLIKPDPAIFALLLSRYSVDPARAVFIDDAPRNITAARAAGLTALHFRNAATLAAELSGLGLLVSPERANG